MHPIHHPPERLRVNKVIRCSVAYTRTYVSLHNICECVYVTTHTRTHQTKNMVHRRCALLAAPGTPWVWRLNVRRSAAAEQEAKSRSYDISVRSSAAAPFADADAAAAPTATQTHT